jgi:hypothetical protein
MVWRFRKWLIGGGALAGVLLVALLVAPAFIDVNVYRSATANIATQTNLASATTQTTINFVIAEDPSGPYVITTVSGPLSGLSIHATRGPARDPPDIEKLVPNISRLPPSNPSSLLPSISVPHIPVPSIPNPFGR